jgi:excisionase family DNA binding protein
MEDYLLSVSEVSVRFKTNKNVVYQLINNKLLSALKLGSLKIRNSEVNRFLKEYDGKDLSDLDNIKEL